MIPNGWTSHCRCILNITNCDKSEKSWKYTVNVIKDWVQRKHSEVKIAPGRFYYGGTCDAKSTHASVKTARFVGDGDEMSPQCWAMELREKDREYPCRGWQTELGLQQTAQGIYTLALTLSYGYPGGYLGELPPSPYPSVPAFLRTFINSKKWDTRSGDINFSCLPNLLSAGGVADFWQIVENPLRMCPVVYISCKFPDGKTLIDPYVLAKQSAGCAVVYYAENSQIDKKIEATLPCNYRCWNGMVRIFQPHIDTSKETDSKRHRYFLREEVERNKDAILNTILRALVQNPRLWQKCTIKGVSDIYLLSRKHQFRALSNSIQRDAQAGEWRDLAEQFLKENEALSAANQSLEEKIMSFEEETETQQATIERLEREKISIKKSSSSSEDNNDIINAFKEFPNSLPDVIGLIEKIHSDKIYFTDSAKKSANNYKRVPINIAWDCLWCMAEFLHPLFFSSGNKTVDIEKEFKNKSGFDLAMTEGKQTNKDKKYEASRRIAYKGKEIDITPHVKHGNKSTKTLRVHFFVDEDAKRIVIGHCAGHLDNFSTTSGKR